MSKKDEELIGCLHRSIAQIIRIYQLLKVDPPELKVKTLSEYAKLVQQLLAEVNVLIPRMCVPKSLFVRMEKESLQIGELAENYMKQHRKDLIDIKVLQDRLKQSQQRERTLKEEKDLILKSFENFKRKVEVMRKNNEETVKTIMEIKQKKESRNQRRSLPHLDRKQKISLLYLMGPSNNNERLVRHLMTKR